jgi:hypothetical protein
MDPADTDAVSDPQAAGVAGTEFDDLTDDLVSGYHRQPRRCGATFDLIEFGMTDAAGTYCDQHLTGSGLRYRQRPQRQRFVVFIQIDNLFQNHCLHLVPLRLPIIA